jgi:hypothetical protein
MHNYKMELPTYWIGSIKSGDDYTALALIVDDILFAHKVFSIINPFFFPVLLVEVLKLEPWMKNWRLKWVLGWTEFRHYYSPIAIQYADERSVNK